LRGGALQEAQAWAKGKNLSYLDQQFLAACEKKEIEEQIGVADKEAQLERERKNREAAGQRNQVLAEAQREAKQWINIGTAFLVLSLVGSTGVLVMASKANQQAERKTTLELQKAQQTIIELKKKIAELEAK
jgi:hypothetical protein